jgi:hypothetical protein
MKFASKAFATATIVAWILVILKYTGMTNNPAGIGQVYVLLFGAFILTASTIICMILVVLKETTVETSREVGKCIHGKWDKLTPKEKENLKSKVSKKARQANQEYQQVKAGKKDWVPGIIDTFL